MMNKQYYKSKRIYVLVPSIQVSGVIEKWEEKNQSTLKKLAQGKILNILTKVLFCIRN
jgi:hypothetical protein